MPILRDGLARCPVKGCTARYPTGGDRLCHDHAEEAAADWAGRLAELAGTTPGDQDGGAA